MSVSETRNSGVTFTHPTEFYLQIEICQLSDILVHSCDADKMKIKKKSWYLELSGECTNITYLVSSSRSIIPFKEEAILQLCT